MTKKENLPLFKQYNRLIDIPWVSINNYPTPIERMINLSTRLGIDIYVKRDDLTNQNYGGNKPRKHEFVFGDALQKGKEKILTLGSIGTNQGLATSILAKKFDLGVQLYLTAQPLTEHVRQNLLSAFYHGAKLKLFESKKERDLAAQIKNSIDSKLYFVITGASSPLGTLGFVNAALELGKQIEEGVIPEPDKIFIAVGSLGTVAGLLIGFELLGLKTEIQGIAVTDPEMSSKENTIKLAEETLNLMRKYDENIPKIDFSSTNRLKITHEYFGDTYGKTTKEGLKAIEVAQEDSLELDRVYTGKTLSALIDKCQKGTISKEETILFWNTKNSIDISESYKNVDYKDLPEEFHKFFDGTVELEEEPIKLGKKTIN